MSRSSVGSSIGLCMQLERFLNLKSWRGGGRVVAASWDRGHQSRPVALKSFPWVSWNLLVY